MHRRRGRTAAGSTLLEGPHLVEAALGAGVAVARVFLTVDDEQGRSLVAASGVPVTIVDRSVLEYLGTTEMPQSPIAVMPIPSVALPSGGRVIVAWGMADPGNCGTLLRSAAAFGYGFGAAPGTADLWSPKVLRSAAGAHFATAIGPVADLAAARTGGRTIVATVARGGVMPGPIPGAVAIVVGSEAEGLPAEVVAAADITVAIPTVSGVESLNAAVAGAIVAYLSALEPGTNLPAA